MSYTNHTTNYNLPQYIGTDKPTYLGDFNSAMSAIDAQMKLNADTASTAGTNATTANTNIGTLANLQTEVKTDLVNVINEVNTSTGTAQNTATTASATATSALASATNANNEITSLKNYLSLSSITNYGGSNMSVTAGASTLTGTPSITVARNSEGSLCKIYGQTAYTIGTQGSNTTIKINADTGLRPEQRLTITNCGFTECAGNLANVTMYINTDGTIEFQCFNFYVPNGTEVIRMTAVLIFVKDFGDTPQPD